MTVVDMRFDLLQNASYTLFWPTSIVIGFILLVFGFMNTSDPYGMYHIGLNFRPGDDPSAVLETEWLNMGYWKVNTVIEQRACRWRYQLQLQNTHIFPVACEG